MNAMRPCRQGAALLVALFLVPALPMAAVRAEESNDEASNPRLDAMRIRFEKQMAAVEEQLKEVQQAEFKLNMQILKAQAKAIGDIKERKNLEKSFREGKLKEGMSEYRQVIELCAKQLQAHATRYQRVERAVQDLSRDLERLPEGDGYQARYDHLADRVGKYHRGIYVRIGDFYRGIAEYRSALAAYQRAVLLIPEDQRTAKEHESLLGSMKECQNHLSPKKDDDKKDNDKKDNNRNGGGNNDKGGWKADPAKGDFWKP